MKKQIFLLPTFWVAIILVCFTAISVQAQTTPPPIHWQFTAASKNAPTPAASKEDWIYNLIQATDGSLVAAGFSEDQTGAPRPTIFKYFNGRKQVMWEYNGPAAFHCSSTATSNEGNFQDVIEASGNYYAAGFVTTSANCAARNEEIMIARTPVQTGINQQASVTLAELRATKNGATGPSRAYSIRPILTNNQLSGFIVCGTVTIGLTPLAFIMKLNPDLSKDNNFGNLGTVTFENFTFGRQAIVHYNSSSVPDGFYMVGDIDQSTTHDGSNPNRDLDVYVNATDLAGNLVPSFRHVYNDANISSISGYTASTKTTTACSSVDLTTNQTEHGISIEQVSTGFILSTQFKAFKGFSGECSIGDGYVDVDAMLININTSGTPIWVKRAARFTGIDYYTPVKVGKNGEYYLLGSTLLPSTVANDRRALTTLVNVKANGTLGWQKSYLADKDGAKFNCPFGLAITDDGGFAIGGNNELNDEDYYILKLRSDCQNNLTFSGDDIFFGKNITSSETWSTNRKVRGKIVVKAGQTLTIQNATIQFLSSLETNDYQKLALNNGTATETKILVEPTGHLVLNNAVLRGVNSCGKDWMWEGVEVWGSPNQAPSLQGTIVMSNGSQIRDAIVGLSMGSKSFNADGNTNPDNYQGGGIATVSNSNIINCRRSLWFAPHIYSNQDNGSTFSTTKFETTNAMVDENYINIDAHRLGINSHVSMLGVKGISYSDCNWSNNYDGIDASVGVGIVSWEASAYVVSSGDATTKTVPNFSNLAWGIDAGFAMNTVFGSYSISNNLFKNVMSSIRMNGGANLLVNKNVFRDIPNVDNISQNGYAINVTGSQLNTISQNKLLSVQGATSLVNHGIIATNTSTSSAPAISNIIGNDIIGLAIGNQMQESNSAMTIRCNNYTGNTTTALAINLQSSNGPFNDQGSCGLSANQAGNKFFDRVCNNPGRHIISGLANSFTYNFRANQPQEVPDCVNGSVITNQCGTSQTNTNTCGDVGGIMGSLCYYTYSGWVCVSAPPTPTPTPDPSPTLQLLAANSIVDNSNRMIVKSGLMRYAQGKGDTSFLMAILASEDLVAYKKLYAQAKMEMKKSNEARALHKELLAQNKISKDYHALYSILTDLSEENKNIMQLSKAQLAKIKAIGDGDSDVKYTAKGILAFVLADDSYSDVIERGRPTGFDNNEHVNALMKKVTSTTTMLLTPNPTQDLLNIQFPNTELNDDTQLIVTDMLGRTVKEVKVGNVSQYSLNVQNIPNGVYFCTLLSNQKTIEVQKFSIIK